MTYAYSIFDIEDEFHKPTRTELDLAQLFVDASTGQEILRAPTSRDVEIADTGSGLGVTPIGGPFVSHNLNIVRVDDSATYKLRDTTHIREIITYDAANSDTFNSDTTRGNGINGGTLPVSEDADGDKNWNRVPTSSIL